MEKTARRLAIWDDLLAAPDDGRTYEIIAGILEAFPRPRPRHGLAQSLISSELVGPFGRGRGGPGGWWIVIEPDVRFSPNDIVAPDVAGWRRERLPDLPPSGPVDVAPDWICEVLSPRGERRDRVVKAELYLRSGVHHYWILDIDGRTLEAFAAREGAWVRLGAWSDGDVSRIPPFEAIEFDVTDLFPPLASEGT